MNEIEDADDDLDNNNLSFIGSNKKKFEFNTFKMPLNFLSDIYNGRVSLKEAEIKQKYLRNKIEELKFGYRPENVEEKEEIDKVLMHANDMLEYRDKIISAFNDDTFLSEHLKISDDDDAAYNHALE